MNLQMLNCAGLRFAVLDGRWAITCCFLGMCMLVEVANAQQEQLWNNQRKKWLPVKGDTLVVDSLSLVPGSLHIADVADSCFVPHELRGYLVWRHQPAEDSVWVTYRVFPEAIATPAYVHRPEGWKQGFVLNYPYVPDQNKDLSGTVFPGQLQYNGSLGRSISFGNAQSVILRSALNLQVSGYLGDSIRVQAAVSDQQLPVQPAGNTLTLQDLDEVYVRFIRNPYQLQAGDFDLEGRSYFMRFYKRLQGVEISKGFIDNDSSSSFSFRLAGAISRGIQARNIFQGQEGNQGPYPLHGNQGETPIIVLAGTEKVYLDGQLLQRGADQDYVMDYNTGQISFTPRRVITKDSRIQVEFEYANQHYVNAQWYAEGKWQAAPHLQMDMHVYSNTDNRRSPLLQPLDLKQQQFLRQVGAQVDQAFYPDAVPDTGLTTHVLYQRKDTVVNGIAYDSVYLYTTDETIDTLYNVSFSYVGPGKGDYILSNTLANGRVYSWVAPIQGQHQGEYVPAVLLVAPRSQQLVTLHMRGALSAHQTVEGEWAWSRVNVNTFAPASIAARQGMAAHFIFQDQRSVSHRSGQSASLRTQLGYDFVSHAFQALQPFREVEFNRQWGLPLDSILAPADEHLVSFSSGIFQPLGFNLQYLWQGYWRLGDEAPSGKVQFHGSSHQLAVQYIHPDFRINSQATITRVGSPGFATTLWKPQVLLSKSWRGTGTVQWAFTTGWTQEKNAMHVYPSDSLSSGSYDFQVSQFTLIRSSRADQIGMSGSYRLDKAPRGAAGFGMGSNSKTIRLYGSLNRPLHQLQWNVVYRSLQIRDSQFLFHQDSSLGSQRAGSQLIGQVVDHLMLGDGWIDHHVSYALAGGQQQQLSFTYVPVPAGQGQYEWVDYNHDGIPQVNEFQPATFADQGNYVRIYTPTTAFIPTRQVQWDEQLSIDPAKLWQEPTSWLQRILTQMRLESHLNRALQRLSSKGPFLNPFNMPADSIFISSHDNMSHALFLAPLSGAWNADYSFQATTHHELMLYGKELHRMRQHLAHVRWNFLTGYQLSLEWKAGNVLDSIAQLADQRYDYTFFGLAPGLQYVLASRFSASLLYGYERKQNLPTWGGEKYASHSLTGTCSWSQLTTTRVELSVSFNRIQFSGNTESPAGYSMLQGLSPGTNWLWHMGLIRRLAGNLEINLSYDGRKTGSARIIHTGTATLRAVF